MTLSVVKIIISAVLIALISELSKRSVFLGGVLASLPLISILAMIWLYIETKSIQAVTNLSMSIFWLVIPSLTLFLTLPILLKRGTPFYLSLIISSIATVLAYYLMVLFLQKIGIKID